MSDFANKLLISGKFLANTKKYRATFDNIESVHYVSNPAELALLQETMYHFMILLAFYS